MQSSNRAAARLTSQEVRQLHHPRSKTVQHSLSTLALGTMNCYNPLQANNLSLSVPQPQAYRIIGALASVLLQRTPRPKHARGVLPQNEQKEKGNQTQTAGRPNIYFNPGSTDPSQQRRHITTRKFQTARNGYDPPPPCPQSRDTDHPQPPTGDEPEQWLAHSARQYKPGQSEPTNHQWQLHADTSKTYL